MVCTAKCDPLVSSERPAVASVAADTSAIAPPPPLPSRPDAGPSGGSGGFADLLEASSQVPAPQAQGTPSARADDGSNAPSSSGAAEGPRGGPTTSGLRNCKDAGGPQSTNDQKASEDGTTADTTAAGVTVLAGLAVPPLAFAPLPIANQTLAPSQGAQVASDDLATPTDADTTAPSGNRKDTEPPAGPLAAGLVAVLPGVPLMPVTSAPDSSAPGRTAAVASSSPGTLLPESLLSAPATSTPTLPDMVATDSSSQPSDGGAPPNHTSTTAAPDLLAGVLPAGDAQGADGATPPLLAATIGASEQSAASRPSASPTLAAAVPPVVTAAPLNPMTPLAAEIQVAANTGSALEAEAVSTALPAQIAVRFAGPAHADDDATSDSGTDVLLGSAGAGVGATTATGSNGPSGAGILPSFNGVLSTLQATPGPVTAPQHIAVSPEAVPLAGIPIAIVARAEAGERKFEIRLDPPDLGRIEVQLSVDSSGRATSHLVVDRADTLDLLRRDAPALERALQSAGLTTDDASLQFSLRDQSFAGRDQGSPVPVAPPAPATVAEGDVAPIDAALRRYGSPMGLGGGIDIRV